MSKGKDDEKDYRPKRKVKETKEDEVESVSDTSSESTSAKTKDNTKRAKNPKSKKRKILRTVYSVDRNENRGQMAVLLDENRSHTSLPEETPLHGLRMPRRGVHASSLTLPREKDDVIAIFYMLEIET